MFQPSQTQCLSPTRDKSPSKLTNLWLETEEKNKQGVVLNKHVMTWLFYIEKLI